MKIRKALAVVLSLAMTVTLMPATAFASTAKVANVQTVKDGATANALVRVTLEDPLTEGVEHPQVLTLDVTQHGEFVKFADKVTLKGKADPAKTNAASVVIDTINKDGTKSIDTKSTDDFATADSTGVWVKQTGSTDKSIDLELAYVDTTDGVQALPKDTTFYFYINVEADGADGDEIQVALDGDGASVIDGFSAKTIATINEDGTTATVEDADTVGRGTGIKAAEVTIKETVNAAVSTTTQTVKFSLPKGVTWAVGETDADDEVTTPVNLTNGTVGVTQFSGSMLTAAGISKAVIGNDGRDLTVTFNASKDPKVKEKLVINPVINVTKDASKGDIKLKVNGVNGDISDASGLVIATYGDANVNVLTKDADKLPEVVAGKILDKDNDDFVVSITLEENSAKALTSGKYVDFAFNSDSIQVTTAGINCFVGDKYAKKDYEDGAAAPATLISDLGKDATEDRSEWTLTVPNAGAELGKGTWKNDEANTLTLFIPVTVSADYVGDISLTVKGNAGIDETTVVVGKSVAPVTVETTVTKVVNGAQAQATADVKITENFAGALKEKETVVLELDNLGLTGGVVFKDDGKATVTAGDIEIKDSKKDGSVVRFDIDNESTVASTIVVSDLAINLARILPEGEYNLKVKGTALVENATTAVPAEDRYNNNDFSANAVKAPYINITTAADTAQTGTVANFFLDGSKNSTYTVNGTDATMDAAAYLDSNNRTMVPIRYVAYALGLADTDISYNVGDSTATLSGLTNVVKVTTGSNVLQASNGNVTMDTVAVNNSGRLYVPARFIAQAMGAQVAWDQATKTVTITK